MSATVMTLSGKGGAINNFGLSDLVESSNGQHEDYQSSKESQCGDVHDVSCFLWGVSPYGYKHTVKSGWSQLLTRIGLATKPFPFLARKYGGRNYLGKNT